MELGSYTACLHDNSLTEALIVLAEPGLTSVELNVGGLLASQANRREFLSTVAEFGMELTALNVNGNPLHPDVVVSSKHSRDLHIAIESAGKVGWSSSGTAPIPTSSSTSGIKWLSPFEGE
jgi:sugar phosphate isomerase/epimerase